MEGWLLQQSHRVKLFEQVEESHTKGKTTQNKETGRNQTMAGKSGGKICDISLILHLKTT